jgi:hypothetical protein
MILQEHLEAQEILETLLQGELLFKELLGKLVKFLQFLVLILQEVLLDLRVLLIQEIQEMLVIGGILEIQVVLEYLEIEVMRETQEPKELEGEETQELQETQGNL